MGTKGKLIEASAFTLKDTDIPKTAIDTLCQINPAVYEKSVFEENGIFQVVKVQTARHNDRFLKRFQQSEDIIYECVGNSKLRTGKYIGELVVKNDKAAVKLVIGSGYSQAFESRMLNVANHIFVDTSAKYSADEKSSLTTILQYLFLSTLKRASAVGIPQQYMTVRDQGLSVRGKIDTQQYLTHDIFNKPNLTYRYRERKPVSEIIDVLYYALSLCDKEYLQGNYRELLSYKSAIKSDYSGAVPTSNTIRKAKSATILKSQMFSPYQNALSYAEMLIRKEFASPSISTDQEIVSGWLLDVTELWETYLAELLRLNFPEWDVDAQSDETIYPNAFFIRSIFPDIVMRRGKDIIVLDAKFKKMSFKGEDVDRSDLQQIHSYYAYYSAKGYNVLLAGLVYPTKKDYSDEKPLSFRIFGHDNAETKFGILYVKVADETKNETQSACEEAFVSRLHNLIDAID